MALQLLPPYGMPTDLDQLLRDIVGGVSQYSAEQMKKMQSRIQDLAREVLKDDFTKLHAEVAELRTRVAALETERARAAADSVEPSF